MGPKGEKGDRGEAAFSNFKPPIGTPCYCPEGLKGEKGNLGEPGLEGWLMVNIHQYTGILSYP